MLTSRTSALALAAVLSAALAGDVHAKDAAEPRALYEPVRLTAGATNQLMGVTTADGDKLYFVSDAAATLDLTAQVPVDSGPKGITRGLGDVAWPRVSPDGNRIAYVSYERDATGDVCVRNLSGGEEKCLTDGKSAELQVLWWDSAQVAVLSRADLHGDFVLRRIHVGNGKSVDVTRRNMVGVALDAKRDWLAYIPLDKRRKDVGVTFSNRTGKGVHLLRVGGSAEPLVYEPPLPGVTGYLAFAHDGKFLYFSQYLNDTNRDGAIDGDDHGVIFRVPFSAGKKVPVGRAEPEQLTSARWDCHYPYPNKKRLIATCSHEGSLDIYSLPLAGAVPGVWKFARVQGEITVSRDYWAQLLLYARQLALSSAPKVRVQILRQMMALHVSLREYESALHYAGLLDNLGREASEWARMMAELARHRRADLALVRGQPSRRYIDSESARARDLALLEPNVTGDEQALVRLVVSEIQDDIGDKGAALATFSAIDAAAVADPLLFPLIADRAKSLYGLFADRDSLLTVFRKLAEHKRASTAERLRYSIGYLDELLRGVALDQRAQTIKSVRGSFDNDSEVALMLDVESILLGLSDETQEPVRKALFKLYKKNRDEDRRRALVLRSVQAAAKRGNEYLQYQFATSWASVLRYEDPERKYAEALYRNIVLDRAYGERAQGEIAEARGYFYGSTVSAQSLEGHVGFIEARIAEGKDDLDQLYDKRFAKEPKSPVFAFVKAYRIARELPGQADAKRHQADVKTALGHIERAASAMPRRAEIHQLWGYVLHQRSRRNGSREDAVAANRQYLLALDLAADNKRIRAALLSQLGVVQASLGNHRKALEYYRLRDRLPHVRPIGELGFRVAMARSAQRAGDAELAAAQMKRAAALVEAHKKLSKYRLLVLDRYGLAHASAGAGAKAVEAYSELDDKLTKRPADDPAAMPLNRVKALIGTGSAALIANKPEVAIKALERAREELRSTDDKSMRVAPKVVWNKSLLHDYEYDNIQYRALASGLLAAAQRQRGDLAAAERATVERMNAVKKRYETSKADEDLLALAKIRYQLAELAYRQKRPDDARKQIEAGLLLSDKWSKSTGTEASEVSLFLLRAYAELHLYGGVPRAKLGQDLPLRLETAYAFICKFPNPEWKGERFLFELYLTMLAVPSSR